MRPEELSEVEDVLRAQLGQSAWRIYDRGLNTPLNFVLTRAEKHLGTGLAVYWVENAPAEMFCLRGFSEPVVAYNPRYVVLWADVRAALANTILGPELLPRVAERLSLRLLAELSLSADNPEFAATAMLRSAMAGEGLVFLSNTLMSLEYEPIGVPYMACWFYGLAHELGHFTASESRWAQTRGFLDEDFLLAVDDALGQFNLPEEVRAEAKRQARSNSRGFVLGVDTLRSEAVADIFATSLLFESTVHILREIQERAPDSPKTPEFDLLAFISEMIVSLNVVAFLDRCRRVAAHATNAEPSQQARLEAVLHPIAVWVRLMGVRFYLIHAASVYLFGDEPTTEQRDKVSGWIESMIEGWRPAIEAMDKGLGRSVEFALDRQRRPNVFEVLSSWKRELGTDAAGSAAGRVEVEQFCAFARTLGKWSSVFDTILAVTRDPSAPVEMKVEQGNAYICPWVSGPDGFNRPFGLDTKYGHLIFVFLQQGDLYKGYCDISAQELANGYELKTALFVADSERELREAIALQLPLDQQFILALEGTPEFDRCMKELITGTI